MRVTKMMKAEMLAILRERYQHMTTALTYTTTFEFLIAVVLSAQCTDVRVNIITARIFPQYNTPEKLGALELEQLEALIRDCGLYHSKAKNILATCEILCREYGGQVPNTFEQLVQLPGVGRKTANVLLSQIFDTPAIAVDTHVFRVANRLRLAVGETPQQVEEGLMRAIPRNQWSDAHHWLIWHGRKICKARKPDCQICPLVALCPAKTC